MSSNDVIETLESIKGLLVPDTFFPVLIPLLKQDEVEAAEWFIQQISEMNISTRSDKIANEIIPLFRNFDENINKRLLKEYIRIYLKRHGNIENLNRSLTTKAPWVKLYKPEEIGRVLEDLMLLDEAISWYTSKGLLDEATRLRKTQAEKVSQKVVQGDEITTIQDSVVSRSTIGSGAGDALLSQLERLGALKEKGLLSDNQFEAAKDKLIKNGRT